MAKGKRRGARRETGEELASADTVAVADSRDSAGAVPTARQPRRGTDAESSARPRGLQLRRGDEIAKFVVIEKIGEGGMATVYAAYDPRLDRRVALKLMRPDASEHETPKQGQRRLLREAQALARLSHPNVVVVHEVDEVQGQVYLAMEHVEGGTLRSWVKWAPRAWRDVVAVYTSAGRGLAAAHKAGLVHRDFKPENVLVGDDGRVRVTDFGLVGTTDALTESSPPVERSGRMPTAVPLSSETEPHGLVLGTPGYVAPELYHGRPATERSDQFSFCVALFEALYDHKPFEGETVAEMAASMLDGRMRPAPRRSEVPAWVGAVLERGLSVDPDRRYASMEELIIALEADPDAARRKRRRTIGAASGFVVLAALAAIGFLRETDHGPRRCADAEQKLIPVWSDARRQQLRAGFEATGLPFAKDTFARVAQALDAYAREWTAMRTEACEATRIRGEQSEALMDARMWCLDRRLGELDAYIEVLARGNNPVVVEHSLDGANALIEVDTCADLEALASRVSLPEDPDTRQRVQDLSKQLDRVAALSRAELITEAIALSEPLVAETRNTGWPSLIARALHEHAFLQDDMGSPEAAARSLREALQLASASKDDQLVAAVYVQLLRVAGHSEARFDEAMSMRASVEAALARAGSPQSLEARYESSLGACYDARGSYAEALVHYDRSLQILERLKGPDDPLVATALNNVAVVLDLLGRRDEALQRYARVLAIEETRFGQKHPRVARTLNNLGIVLADRGDLDRAIDHYQRALEIWKSVYGDDHQMVAITLVNLGVTLQQAGKRERAGEALESARVIWENAKGLNRANLATTLVNLGDLHKDDGDCRLALDDYRRSVEVNEEVLGSDHPDLAYSLVGIGSCELQVSGPRAAIPPLERALALRSAGELEASLLAETKFTLARALWRTGAKAARVRRLAEEARESYLAAGDASAKDLAKLEGWLKERGWYGGQ